VRVAIVREGKLLIPLAETRFKPKGGITNCYTVLGKGWGATMNFNESEIWEMKGHCECRLVMR